MEATAAHLDAKFRRWSLTTLKVMGRSCMHASVSRLTALTCAQLCLSLARHAALGQWLLLQLALVRLYIT